MSKFFDSDMVKQTMQELAEMQRELFKQAMVLESFTMEERKEHLNLMREFLEKQKLLFVRMTLSDDPEAIETKNRIIESAKFFGFTESESMDEFFNRLNQTIERLEDSLEI